MARFRIYNLTGGEIFRVIILGNNGIYTQSTAFTNPASNAIYDFNYTVTFYNLSVPIQVETSNYLITVYQDVNNNGKMDFGDLFVTFPWRIEKGKDMGVFPLFYSNFKMVS